MLEVTIKNNTKITGVKASQIRSDADQYMFVLVVQDAGRFNAVDLVDDVGELIYSSGVFEDVILKDFPNVHDDVDLNIYVGGRNE